MNFKKLPYIFTNTNVIATPQFYLEKTRELDINTISPELSTNLQARKPQKTKQ